MAANPKIVSLIDAAQREGGKIVSAVDAILALLKSDSLAYHMPAIHPTMVGIHPANRDGYGVSATEVHALGAEITAMGWSWSACAHAVNIEADATGTVVEYTCKLKNEADGMARCDPKEICFGSLSCSHTNQWLCCVLSGVESEHEILCVDNRMSQAMLSEKDPAMGKALAEGMPWLVLKAKVAILYPTLPDLIQKAKNDPGRAQRQEGEVQVLFRIARLAKAKSTKHDGHIVVDWQTVEKVLLQRKLSEPEDLPHLVKFVQRWGGGIDGIFLEDLNNFHKVFVASGRIIPGPFMHNGSILSPCRESCLKTQHISFAI